MSAGLELFGTEGYAATSIEKLCATAAVSTRNFYEEFTGREALLMALHDRVIERAVAAVAGAFATAGEEDLAARIELAVRAYITTTAEDPRWARLSYVETVGVSDTVEQHRLDWRDRWVELLVAEAERAVAHGDAAERDFRLGARALIGAVNELVYHWSRRGEQTPLDEVITEIVRLAVAVIKS
ncbi:TetR/AcrR family transcriptional regulator [Amycolatopsis cihanbeyliensis]